jgi:nicotinamidase-related amidase
VPGDCLHRALLNVVARQPQRPLPSTYPRPGRSNNRQVGNERHPDQRQFALAVGGARPDLVKPIVPDAGWPFLEKVRHSAFYATSLEYLLTRLETKSIILTGQVTEQCILYTALDAYIRHFDVTVPSDAVAHIDAELGKAALRMMQSNMRATVVSAADCLR